MGCTERSNEVEAYLLLKKGCCMDDLKINQNYCKYVAVCLSVCLSVFPPVRPSDLLTS